MRKKLVSIDLIVFLLLVVFLSGCPGENLAPYSESGTLDTSFGDNGIVVHHNAAGGDFYDSAHSIAIDSNGKIFVTGDSYNSLGNYDMVIWRYNP